MVQAGVGGFGGAAAEVAVLVGQVPQAEPTVSGRGGLVIPISSRAATAAPAQRPAGRPEEEQLTEEQRLRLGAFIAAQSAAAGRCVLPLMKEFLVSGAAGGAELNAPAVVDARRQGHGVLGNRCGVTKRRVASF